MASNTHRIRTLAAAVAFTLASGGALAQSIDSIHFIIPGGAGGGWDGTARGTGEALTGAGLVGKASYENMSGGGGGKALNYMVENASSNHDTLMVFSTPAVIRSVNGTYADLGRSWRDLTPIAGTIGDYAALAVKADSDIRSVDDLIAIYRKNPADLAVAGGSVPGGMDHLVAAMAFKAAGEDPTRVNYLSYDAGEAIAGLLSGEADVLSTGLSEVLELERSGQVRILASTAPERIDDAPDVPTLREQGVDATFINWRGFFAVPGVPAGKKGAYIKALGDMYDTPEWETVRSRNGWVNIYNPGDDFMAFLVDQEDEVRTLMTELGFL